MEDATEARKSSLKLATREPMAMLQREIEFLRRNEYGVANTRDGREGSGIYPR